ncbi:MAG: hypothetical protein KC613_23325, partial [Myxococcales bacterium]|nr:hypothetical protein [Myxococcales bacterium]
TRDLVELVDLLEGAVAHRLQYARLGMDPEEWRESLQHTAGRWLADRVLRLAGHTLQHAVALLMAGPERITEVEGFIEGGQGLARLGLATVQRQTVRLGPLARQLDDPFIRGAFLDRMPADAFNEQARRFVVAGEMAPSRGGGDLDVPVRRSGDLLWRSVVEALELERIRVSEGADAAAAAAAEAGLHLLGELCQLPAHVEALSAALTDRVRAALAAGEPFALDGTPLARLLHLLAALLRFTCARGPRELATRDQAALSLDLLVRVDDPEAYRLARGAVTAELAWDLALSAPDRAALEAVDARCDRMRRQLPPRSAAALSLQGVVAWLAERRGDLGLAETLHAERLAGYEALGAAREAAVTRGRLARLKVGRCELEAAEADLTAAVATFEALGAQHDLAIGQGDIARLRARQGRIHEALQLHR